jgi:hypothetical protein
MAGARALAENPLAQRAREEASVVSVEGQQAGVARSIPNLDYPHTVVDTGGGRSVALPVLNPEHTQQAAQALADRTGARVSVLRMPKAGEGENTLVIALDRAHIEREPHPRQGYSIGTDLEDMAQRMRGALAPSGIDVHFDGRQVRFILDTRRVADLEAGVREVKGVVHSLGIKSSVLRDGGRVAEDYQPRGAGAAQGDSGLAAGESGASGGQYADDLRAAIEHGIGRPLPRRATATTPATAPDLAPPRGQVSVQAAALGGAGAGLAGAMYGASQTQPGQSLLQQGRERLGEGLRTAGSAIGAASDVAREGRDTARDLIQADWNQPLDDPEMERDARDFAVSMARAQTPDHEPTAAEIEAKLPWARSSVMGAYGAMGMAPGVAGLRPHVPPRGPRGPTPLTGVEKAGQQFGAYVASNLLSGIPGVIRNLPGGPMMAASEVGTTALSPLNEAVLRGGKKLITLIPGVGGSVPARTRFASELLPVLRGAGEGVKKGVPAAGKALVGKKATSIGMADLETELFGGRNNPLNWPLRVYGANDAGAREVGLRLGDRRAAERIASIRGVSGPYRAATVELLEDLGRRARAGDENIPPILQAAAREVMEAGDIVAKRLTVRDGFGVLDRKLAILREIPFAGPLLVPFSTGVNAAAKAGYQHSPLALGELLVRGLKGGKKGLPAGYGDMTDRMAKIEMGAMAALGAVTLYNSGFMTGAAPTKKSERDIWDAQGNVPYSFNLGGGFHLPFQVFTPLAPTLMATANYLDAVRDGKPALGVEAAAAAGQGFLAGAGNLPFMDAWADVVDLKAALDTGDPARIAPVVERFATSRAGGLVPASGFLRTVARGTDVRRAPEGLVETLQSAIPGISGGTKGTPLEGAPVLSEHINERLGPRGEVLPNPGPLSAILSPARQTAPSSDSPATYAEAARTDAGFPSAGSSVAGTPLTKEQQFRYDRLVGVLSGRYRDALYATPAYKAADDTTKQRLAALSDTRARDDARERAMSEFHISGRAEGEPPKYDESQPWVQKVMKEGNYADVDAMTRAISQAAGTPAKDRTKQQAKLAYYAKYTSPAWRQWSAAEKKKKGEEKKLVPKQPAAAVP